MMDFIRKANRNDASRLAEILVFTKRCTYRTIFQNDKVSFNELQVLDLALFYQNQEGALKDLYVYDDDIVRGMIHVSEVTDSKDEVLFQIEELYVDFFFKNQGIGTALLEYGILLAKQKDANELTLWVLEKNMAARKFYEALGFVLCGERKEEAGTPEYIIKYRKTL